MFYRVASAVPALNVADCNYNTDRLIELTHHLATRGVSMAVFPELSITGYTCGDLFHNDTLLEGALDALQRYVRSLADYPGIIAWVGMPLVRDNQLYNCAVAVQGGKILAVIPKNYLPAYNEFYEKRWWVSGHDTTGYISLLGADVPFGTDILLSTPGGVTLSAEICEDLWAPVPPSSIAALNGAQVIANLSASDDLAGKYHRLVNLVKEQSARCGAAYVYSSAGFGESSTDLVFDGKCLIAECGSLLAESERWQRDSHFVIADIDLQAINRDRLHFTTFADCRRAHYASYRVVTTLDNTPADTAAPEILHPYSATPFVPSTDSNIDLRATEIINIQTAALSRRLAATHCHTAVIGISGGLDSTLALLVTVNSFDSLNLDRRGIIGVTMPGFGTTGRTYNNALTLMRALGITVREISIVPAVNQHFSDIGHDPAIHDVTYENSQARQRTLLLMDIANQENGMVIGTGDLSELALGWATYNGDHMSMYGVNAGVPKTLVKYLVKWFASRSNNDEERRSLLDIFDTPISPELIPADEHGNITQKTEDLVGPYELHDFFLYHTLRYGRSPRDIYRLALHAFAGVYDDATVLHWLKVFGRRFFTQQFKRSCMPDGPKVGSVCLSPRGDWRMPSDASRALWQAQLDILG
ncbi:MAG: NAD(+) synthase [Clostridiales bacterium]|nr:NAD(+) synthase [Clostridiales bacterium]